MVTLSRTSVAIPVELIEFLTSGISILVATRDAALVPDAVRAFAPRISADRRLLDVILPCGLGDRSVQNVRDNGRIAVSFSRAIDHVSVQVKGTSRGTRPTNEADRSAVERYHAAYIEGLYLAGMPRSLTSRFRTLPGVVVTVEVEGVFSQTPGPGAGNAIEAR